MKLFPKSFRCQTNLTLDQCKQRLQNKFPNSFFSQTRLKSFVVHGDSATVTLIWSGRNIGIFPLRLDATLTQKADHVQIMGNAHALLFGVIMAIYFLGITLILTIVFIRLLWLSAFFLLFFGFTGWIIYNTFQARNRLIDKVCNALER